MLTSDKWRTKNLNDIQIPDNAKDCKYKYEFIVVNTVTTEHSCPVVQNSERFSRSFRLLRSTP